MNIKIPGLYHIYNRGNFKQPIFYTPNNYLYFLEKCQRYIMPVSEILAWCLMTNHFHFLIEVTGKSIEPVKSGGIIMPAITNGFRLLQSSYAKGVNKQQDRTGNLFQQKTKVKLIDNPDYLLTAFFYIHQNPVAAKFVSNPEDWAYSSWREYTGVGQFKLCNLERGKELLGLTDLDLMTEIRKDIGEEKVQKIF